MVTSLDWAMEWDRDCKWLGPLGLWLLRLPLAGVQEQAEVTPFFGGIPPDKALLPRQRARLAHARTASGFRAVGVPGVPLFLGQGVALAPGF